MLAQCGESGDRLSKPRSYIYDCLYLFGHVYTMFIDHGQTKLHSMTLSKETVWMLLSPLNGHIFTKNGNLLEWLICPKSYEIGLSNEVSVV